MKIKFDLDNKKIIITESNIYKSLTFNFFSDSVAMYANCIPEDDRQVRVYFDDNGTAEIDNDLAAVLACRGMNETYGVIGPYDCGLKIGFTINYRGEPNDVFKESILLGDIFVRQQKELQENKKTDF